MAGKKTKICVICKEKFSPEKDWKTCSFKCSKELRKLTHRKKNRRYHLKFRNEIFKLLGDRCLKCGFSDKRALQIDHLNGGGYRQRIGKNPITVYKYILQHPKEFQILCANCNQIKRVENLEFANKYKIPWQEQ